MSPSRQRPAGLSFFFLSDHRVSPGLAGFHGDCGALSRVGAEDGAAVAEPEGAAELAGAVEPDGAVDPVLLPAPEGATVATGAGSTDGGAVTSGGATPTPAPEGAESPPMTALITTMATMSIASNAPATAPISARPSRERPDFFPGIA